MGFFDNIFANGGNSEIETAIVKRSNVLRSEAGLLNNKDITDACGMVLSDIVLKTSMANKIYPVPQSFRIDQYIPMFLFIIYVGETIISILKQNNVKVIVGDVLSNTMCAYFQFYDADDVDK